MMNLRLIVVSAIVGFSTGMAAVHHQSGVRRTPGDQVVPGVVILKLLPQSGVSRTNALSAAVTAALSRHGVQAMHRAFPGVPTLARANPMTVQGLDRIYYATVPPSADVVTLAAALARLPGVAYAEPKYLQTIYDVPDDPDFATQQTIYFSLMHAQDAWTVVKTNGSVIVADVDGGTYWQHEDLTPNLWINSGEDINHNGKFDTATASAGGDINGIDDDGDGYVDDVIGWNFTANTDNPDGSVATPGSASHGTATASLMAAVTNNGVGMAGSAWNPKLMPINTASATSDNSIAYGYEGIQFAAAHGAKVINCSWGRQGSYSQFEHDVVIAATASGSLIVAAAANASTNNDLVPNYPSSFKEVLGVGATNSTNDIIAGFTNFGISVSVYAPGVNVFGALNGGGYGSAGSGTSFSSPLTAGLAAMLFAQHPSWTPRQVATQIRVTADPIDAVNPSYTGYLGHGRVNFYRAVTESHPGLEVTSVHSVVSSGESCLVTRDTVRIVVTLKNILPQSAANAQFTLTSPNGTLRVVSGAASIASVGQDDSVSLPDFIVVADTVTGTKDVDLALRWVSNGTDADAYALPYTVFSSAPSWQLHDTPASSTVASGFYSIKAVDVSVLWAAGGDGAGSGPVVARSVDGGNIWTDATGDLSRMDLYCITGIDSLHAWVGTADGRIFATSDGGVQWTQQSYPGTQSPFIDGIWFFDPQNGRALGDPASSGGTYIILKTTDGGRNWSHVLVEPTGSSGEAGWNNSWWWSDPSHGWFGTNAGKVWRTSDGGAHWASATTTATNSLGVAFGDSLHGVAIHDNGVTSVTTDGGATWSNGTKLSSYLAGIAFAPGAPDVWAVDPAAPYHSVDDGQQWVAETTFPFDGSITHVTTADPTHAWAATSFGQILSYIPRVTGIALPSSGGAPSEYTLFPNYPNPFNPSTILTYRVGSPGRIRLSIYDVLGRQVAVLVDGNRPTGTYTVRWDATACATGAYFARLTAMSSTAPGTIVSQVRKLLLLR
jgi:photosystem II stability/assembly factor-like uncharacterized protein